jgi:hypothetical protein
MTVRIFHSRGRGAAWSFEQVLAHLPSDAALQGGRNALASSYVLVYVKEKELSDLRTANLIVEECTPEPLGRVFGR